MARGFGGVFVLCFLFVSAFANAEEKALKDPEVLKIRNYELNLQNAHLQIEVLKRDINRVQQERDAFIEGLYKSYQLDPEWKIDLEKGVWFKKEASLETPPAAKGKAASPAQ